MEFDAVDTDGDQKLDFDEFVLLVRERGDFDYTQPELIELFTQLDEDGSGKEGALPLYLPTCPPAHLPRPCS